MPKRKILVVEDHLINREILLEILADEYTVLEAENGEEALKILYEEKSAVSLVLLDLIMPVMDGYTFLDRIKEDEELSLIPIIVTTQYSGEASEIEALSRGATEFLPKPYNPQIVRHRIANLISLRETAAFANKMKRDALTGLYDKEYFYQKVKKELAANPGGEFTVVSLNVENFKLYNDIYGFPAGDSLLKEIGNVLKKAVGDLGICSKFSADRFFCIIRRKMEVSDLDDMVDRIQNHSSPIVAEVKIDFGVYIVEDTRLPVEVICDRARLAVNSVKGKYGKQYAVYDDSMLLSRIREKALTDSMADAVVSDQFEVYLQPKYSLNDKRMSGAEALVRWNHPTLGMISPSEFIPLFEENGFITELDKFVWEKVSSLLHDWQEIGVPLFPISINVSRSDVYRIPLAATIFGLTEKYGLKPSYLRIEITESAYSEHPEQIRTAVNELRALGFAVDMDDFGSGYSSLTMLGQVSVDALKLDNGFVKSEMSKEANNSLIADVINMAHRLHLSVVAEGVETLEQMQRLQQVNCDYVQGYLFAKPMPAANYERLCRAQTFAPPPTGDELPCTENLNRRVLVVDENEKYRNRAVSALKETFDILESSDGEQALNLINQYGNKGICGIVLSASLPDNNAELIVRALRCDPAFWNIPILLTLPSNESVDNRFLVASVSDFVCKIHPISDVAKRVKLMIETNENLLREKSLKMEARVDSLTGLKNRVGFLESFNSLKTEDLPLAVCALGLESKRSDGDCVGGFSGDNALITFSDFLRRNTNSQAIISRYDGGEFFVVFKGVKDEESALAEGFRLCSLFKWQRDGGVSDKYICTGGVAFCNDVGELSDTLLKKADRALNNARRSRKGECVMWKDS